MSEKYFKYRKEFYEEKQKIISSRLRPFCSLAILIYIGVSVFALLLDQEAFRSAELFIWVFLVAAAAVVLSINRTVKTLLGAKVSALLFSASMVLAITALFFIYPDYRDQSSEILALSAFFISFIIPWSTFEVLLIGGLHVLGYTFIYAWAVSVAPSATEIHNLIFGRGAYVDDLIFLMVAIMICAIIRKRDERREKESFALLKELEGKNEQMARELAIARDIQKTLIPKSTSTENVAIAVSYVPLSAVGGDYATFHVTKEGNIFFLIGDVTGHGVPAALLVNRIYGEIETLIAHTPEPGRLMKELDKFVQEHFRQTQMYFSVCSGLIDFGNKTLFYSNYGHPPQILHKHRDNKISLLESQTYLLGVEAKEADQNIFEGKLTFDRKDRIVLFTDGLIETKGTSGEFYGMERLEAFVKDRTDEQPGSFNSTLLTQVDAYRDGPIADDIFLVTIDIK